MTINYVYISRTKTIVTIIFRANGKNYYYCFLLLSFIPRRRSYQLSRKSLSGLILRLKYNNIITIYLRRRMYTTMSVNTFCFHFLQAFFTNGRSFTIHAITYALRLCTRNSQISIAFYNKSIKMFSKVLICHSNLYNCTHFIFSIQILPTISTHFGIIPQKKSMCVNIKKNIYINIFLFLFLKKYVLQPT